jgi:hypothetical protein
MQFNLRIVLRVKLTGLAFVIFVFVSTSYAWAKACKIAEKKVEKDTGIPKT